MDNLSNAVWMKSFIVFPGLCFLVPGYFLIKGNISFRVRGYLDWVIIKGAKAKFYGAMFTIASLALFSLLLIG